MKKPEHFFHPFFSLRLLTSSATLWLAFLTVIAAPAHAQITADDWQPGQITLRAKQTEPHEEVQKAMRQNKNALAMQLIDRYMERNPRDPQMRFLKANLLERTQQRDQAFVIYQDLTHEYPELPEPHNNMGVIYAARGDYENAQAAFQAALRANPSYAVAEENLADMLLHRAQFFYQSALNHSNQQQRSAAKKLELLRPALALSEAP
jgi:Flp pilus assembly protein TadD